MIGINSFLYGISYLLSIITCVVLTYHAIRLKMLRIQKKYVIAALKHRKLNAEDGSIGLDLSLYHFSIAASGLRNAGIYSSTLVGCISCYMGFDSYITALENKNKVAVYIAMAILIGQAHRPTVMMTLIKVLVTQLSHTDNRQNTKRIYKSYPRWAFAVVPLCITLLSCGALQQNANLAQANHKVVQRKLV